MTPAAAFAWFLDAVAATFVAVLLTTLYYMVTPVDVNGAGRLGYGALMMAPQLLLATVAAALLWLIARMCAARPAQILFAVAVVLSAVMSIWPTISVWERSRAYGVSVSIVSVFAPQISTVVASPEKTVTYAVVGDSPLVLDVWRAGGVSRERLRPAIVKVHGGDWTRGTRGELHLWNQYFNDLGYDVFDVDYRLPPTARWRDEVGDVRCAIGWVAANAEKFGVDSTRISLMGYSAGGNLALLAAYAMDDSRLPSSCGTSHVKIRSVIDFYGPSDLTGLYSETGSPSLIRTKLESYIGGPPSEFSSRYRLLSPIAHVAARVPPTIVFHGESDRVVPEKQSRALDQALSAAGVYHETYYLPWSDHGYDAVWNSIATQITREKLRIFLERIEAR